ncbi:S1 RNA-binding domain-containing protein [Candidatus Micrarchaeota archaeon]|nr:S1 RNA-binding domain-containing protein [Candidatus Micrarchaeota archaeon]
MNYPELNELAVGIVRKIMPFGAVVSLPEYGNLEAFIHISEVSSGWIKNIREHLKEDQIIVVRTTLIDKNKNQIDASVKRVSEIEKKRKLASYQSQKRALKLLEQIARKTGKTFDALQKQVEPLVAEFGDLYTVFEALSQGYEPKTKVPKQLLTILQETAKQEIKIKIIELKAQVTAVSYAPNGVKELSELLKKLPNAHYLGSGKYLITISSPEIKQAEKKMNEVSTIIEKSNSTNFEASMERLK